MVEVLFQEQRDTAAATAFFRSALENTGVTPHTGTTDQAAAYLPALADVLPTVEHLTGKAEQQSIERDHQHLKGRLPVFRGCQSAGGAQRFCRAHGFVRNLRPGFYRLGAAPRDPNDPIRPFFVQAWEALTIQLLTAEPGARSAPRAPPLVVFHNRYLSLHAPIKPLKEWLGHRRLASTEYYVKPTPTKLAKSYTDAEYFQRNLHCIEVLLDQEAIASGAATSGQHWKFYDLGHGYCSYDFFEQCPHRIACAKCSFYLPKESNRAHCWRPKQTCNG